MERGTTLAGRYVVQEAGHRTVCGDFYLARDRDAGLPVVIQTVPESIARQARWLAGLRHNVALLHALDHPRIAKLHGLEYDPERQLHFLVREHVVGVSLLEYRLSRPGHRLAVDDALAICRQLADALDHAHRLLLHRNLRPDNVILTPDGRVKLWNFDLIPFEAQWELHRLADWDGDCPEARSACYRAPEQCIDPAAASPSADLWALAVLFYELVGGRLPFDATEPEALVQMIRTSPPAAVRGLGRRRNRVLVRALAKDPGYRFGSAHAFIEALESGGWPHSMVEWRRLATVTLPVVLLLTLLVWDILMRVLPGPATGQAPRPEAVQAQMVTPDLKKSLLLQVESRPTAATVVLDGKRLGTTPFTVGRVAPGAYHLWLEKAGFKPVDMEIDLTQDTIVSMNLDPSAASEPAPGAAATAATDGTAPAPPVALSASADTGAPAPVPTSKPLDVQPVPPSSLLTKASLPSAPDPGVTATGVPAGQAEGRLASPVPAPVVREEMLLQATQWIEAADAAIKAGHLTKPARRNACDKLQAALALHPRHPDLGKTIHKLVERYLPLAKSKQIPQPILTLLDQAVAALPDDADVAAARQALSLPVPAVPASPPARSGPATVPGPQSAVGPGDPAPGSSPTEPTPLPPLSIVATPVVTLSQPDQNALKTWRDPVTHLEFVWIDQGCFQMGSAQGDEDEGPVHPVCLKGFWLGRHEVTQAAWQRAMPQATNPAQFQKGGEYPVDSVSWESVQGFIRHLNSRSDQRFRLPTEAEWEYACRAGSQTPFHFGNSIHAGKANFNGERTFGEGTKGYYVGSTLPVGLFPANRFGLFDMHGNVAEWVEDVYQRTYYRESPVDNPLVRAAPAGQPGSVQHGLRGGAWYSSPHHLRCAARQRGEATQRDHGQGFRLVREVGA
ncbi:MAG: SUMF1/EgtB/PvdO family nonheme iron enzyme [Magnetococcus sp. DMHC-8]